MEWLVQELETSSRKRVARITGKLNRLAYQNDADAFLNVQDICCSLESYMRELRRVEHRVVESWHDTHSDHSIVDDDFHFPDCRIVWDGEILRIRLGAVLPFKTKLHCDLHCEELEETIRRYVADKALPVPVFYKAVVVFLHHSSSKTVRVRDYDNLERKGVLDVLVPLLIADDNPRNIRTCDFLVEDSDDYTEILIMDWAAFQRLVDREEFAF